MPGRTVPPRRLRPSSRIRAAAARAVDAVLSSEEAFALLVRRLEAAGWHVEREPRAREKTSVRPTRLTPSSRTR